MNEVGAARQGAGVPDPGTLWAAQVTAQSGTAVGIDTRDASGILARAHHGSMSRAERTRTETELKSGHLPAVVATSSLELGIDMGAVDLVVQVGAPPSVASGLQRVGRAGHQVGAVSRGVIFPTHRGDLVPSAVTAGRMRVGAIEELRVPANPLDVLAQQVVAMVAMQDWTVEELSTVVRRSAPFTGLGEATLRAVLDMLAGRYPSEDFAELRPRIVWDRATGVLSARPGAIRLAVTSGGTIPDRGLYGVFLVGADQGAPTDAPTRARGGRRVGELDEEMVYESRVGDTFTLGSSTWRIEEITSDRVLVTPAPGLPGRLPFWKGDSPGRPAELGRAVGQWVREIGGLSDQDARRRLLDEGLDAWAADNLMADLAEQRRSSANGSGPSAATGAWWCAPPTAPACTPPGPWCAAHACATGTAWTPRCCTPTTGSCCDCRTWCRRMRCGTPLPGHGPATTGPRSGSRTCSSSPTRSPRRSGPSSVARRCSPHASGRPPHGPCCCRAVVPPGVSRCGSNGSAPLSR